MSRNKLINQFLRHHRKHPEVWAEFEALCLEKIKKNNRRFSARAVMYALRWQRDMEDKTIITCNYNFTPGYARMFIQKHPQNKKFFRYKHSIFDNVALPDG